MTFKIDNRLRHPRNVRIITIYQNVRVVSKIEVQNKKKNKQSQMAALIKPFISKSSAIFLSNRSIQKCFRSIGSHRLHSTEQTSSDKHYDIIISGGGPAGISMACSICKCFLENHLKIHARSSVSWL